MKKLLIISGVIIVLLSAAASGYFWLKAPAGGQGKCGDGVCDSFEKSAGVCAQDCGDTQGQANNSVGSGSNPVAPSSKRADLTTDAWKKYIDADAPAIYLNVVVNVSDFIQLDKSAKYVGKAVDLFNELGIRADFSFTEPVARKYAEKYPDIVEKIKNNAKFSIGYHLRPPYPAAAVNPHATFADETGNCKTWDSLNSTEKESLLKFYEKYALDVSAWKYDAVNYCSKLDQTKSGGYEALKEIFGRSPLGFGRMSSGETYDILHSILKTKGLQSFVGEYIASKNNLFVEEGGLLLRPSDLSLVFADAWKKSGAYQGFYELAARVAYKDERPVIGNLLTHDYDFYYQDTWYLQTSRGGSLLRSDSERAKFWSDYEKDIRAFAENGRTKIVNTQDLLDMNKKFKNNF